MQQSGAKMGFQIADLLADGGFRQPECLGGSGEAATIDNLAISAHGTDNIQRALRHCPRFMNNLIRETAVIKTAPPS
jgi:hypothetical protein